MPDTARLPVTIRMEPSQRDALDALAQAIGRDRSFVVNEAVEAWLELHRWQVEHIREGLHQADTGVFASEAEVAAVFDRWRDRRG